MIEKFQLEKVRSNDDATGTHQQKGDFTMMKRPLKTMRPLVLSSYCILLLLLTPIAVARHKAPVEGRHCHGSPKHVHIAVGADPATQMQVTFASYKRIESRPTGGVLIGKDPNES